MILDKIKNKKKIVLLVSIAAIALIAAGVTVAWLVAKTDAVVNTFTPAKVTSEVVEDFDKTTKTDVKIKNTSNIDAYIRATVVINWVDGDGNVAAQKPVKGTDYTITFPENTKWFTGSGGYYYFPNPVASGYFTDVLIYECKAVAGKAPEGYSLSVEIIADAIQSVPKDAVESSWPVTVNEDGTISKGN